MGHLLDDERVLLRRWASTMAHGNPGGRVANAGPPLQAKSAGETYRPTGGGGKPYATIVVAAVDSTAASAASADVVCTGTADQTPIAAAIATHGAQGRVLLLEGNFEFSAPLAVPDNWTIEGQGMVATIITSSSFTGAALLTLGALCTVANLGLVTTGAWHGVQAGYLSVVHRILGAGSSTGSIVHAPTGTVHAVVLDSVVVSAGKAVTAAGTGVLVVRGNWFDGWTTSAVETAYHCEVTGNRFVGTGTAIVLTGTGFGQSVIAGNVIETSAAYGITCSQNRPHIHGNATDGISLADGADFFSIHDNRVIASQHSIFVTDCSGGSIHGNDIECDGKASATTYDGIILAGDSNGNSVQNNHLTADSAIPGNVNRYGINVSAAACDANLVDGNNVIGAGVTAEINDAGTTTRFGAGNNKTSGFTVGAGS